MENTDIYIQDENLKKIVETFEKEERRRKLRAKIESMRQNRMPENEENVKYDEKGKKIGRLNKQYISIPKGEIKSASEREKIKQVISSIKDDPILFEKFLKKSGISKEVCESLILEEGRKKSFVESVEEVL